MNDKDLDHFMQMSKMKNADLDKELDELMEEDEELREIMKEDKGKKKKNLEDLNDSINLSDLDEEHEKKEDDIDLKELEEDEKSEKKEMKREEAKPQIVKEEKKEIISIETDKKVVSTKIDLFSEKTENLYHRVDKMQSLGALMDEKRVMDEIVEYKVTNGFDPDFFENKKDVIDVKYKEIENIISFGAMDLEEYKASITNHLKWDEELLKHCEKDQKITPQERDKIIERIKKRIQIINDELTQEVQEEEPEEYAEADVKEENNQNSNPNDKPLEEKLTSTTTATSIAKEEIKVDSQVTVEKKPPEIKNKKLYEEIKIKLEDYKEAAEYFRKIGSAKQEEDAFSKAKELSTALKLMEEGKENKVDEFALPIGITPDYICGYSKQERLNNFSEVIKEFSKRKNELNEALKERVEKLKNVDKKELAKFKDAMTKDLQERKDKIEFYNKLITKLMEYAKNPWVPAPLYSYVEEEEKIEKINEDIDPMWIDIYFGKTNYDKDNAFLLVTLNLSETKQLSEYVYFKKYPNYDTHIKWKLEKTEWNYLFRKYLEIQVYRKHWYWPFKALLKGTMKLKLEALKESSQISDSFAIKLESNRFDPKLDMTIKIRTPVQGKEYNTVSKAVLTITKTFPPFRGEGAIETHNYPGSDKKSNISDKEIVQSQSKSKPQTKTDSKTKIPTSNTNNNLQQSKPKTDKPIIDPSEFSKEELEDPDIPDNLNSVKVLQFKISQLENQIKNIEGRAPPKLREKLLKTKFRKNVLEQQLGDSLQIDHYIMIMNNQLQKDRKLIQYFEQEKKIEQGKKVAERITILIKELEEAIEYSKSQKKK